MDTAIILFVYNRPEHTRKVLDGLKNNNIKELYVFGDGIKEAKHKENVELTRRLINDINWCKVRVEYSNKNRGLANSVIYGISKVFKMGYKKVIVIEDDCIPKSDFIEYMEKAFDFYEKDERIMHISGFGLPLKQEIKKSTYITPYPCSWGWGTWKKYWEKCDFYRDNEYKSLLNDPKQIEKFNSSGSAFSEFLRMQLEGKVNSWLIRWYYHIFRNNGMCVWKTESSIVNDGFDGTGVHKVKFDRFNQRFSDYRKSLVFEEDNTPNKQIIKEFKRYFIDKSFKERFKTLVYMYTGVIL